MNLKMIFFVALTWQAMILRSADFRGATRIYTLQTAPDPSGMSNQPWNVIPIGKDCLKEVPAGTEVGVAHLPGSHLRVHAFGCTADYRMAGTK